MTDHRPQYTVLARRFRPQTFDEVVGQQHVGQALRNAIRGQRVAHAYLFTGARGVGKTSTARIFAKALNCPHVQDGVPCNECDTCHAIGAGNDVDVLEIDGASNRGIDDIRQLRANVNVRSMRSPYKVYIIDEVHMLTKEAFNALLKTLEEPPPNVKFVFCTTEPNKVPDTILSRCQRFDFGTIAADSIKGRLKDIAVAEGRDVDDEAIELVARRAAGSMRDSQSLFDQLLAFGGDVISADDVHRLLGTAPDDRLLDLVEALIEQRQADALTMLDQALSEGVQLGSFSDQLLNYLRDLLVTAVGAETVPFTAVGDRVRPRVQEQAKRWGLQTASAAMQVLAETKSKMQRVNYGRALLELALIRMSLLENLEDLAALVHQAAAGGTVPTAGARPATAVQPQKPASRPATPPPSAPPVKKNVEAAVAPTTPVDSEYAVETQTQVMERPAPAPPPKKQSVPLSAESIDAFWGQVLVETPDSLAQQLKGVSRVNLVGSAVIEVIFPAGKEISRSYCERPETLKRLTGIASKLAGREVGLKLNIDKQAPQREVPPVTKRRQQPDTERKRTSILDNDPFVQQAVSIFGGQVVEVRSVLVAPETTAGPTIEDDQASEE